MYKLYLGLRESSQKSPLLTSTVPGGEDGPCNRHGTVDVRLLDARVRTGQGSGVFPQVTLS